MRNLTNISLPLSASITSFRGGYSIVNQIVAIIGRRVSENISPALLFFVVSLNRCLIQNI